MHEFAWFSHGCWFLREQTIFYAMIGSRFTSPVSPCTPMGSAEHIDIGISAQDPLLWVRPGPRFVPGVKVAHPLTGGLDPRARCASEAAGAWRNGGPGVPSVKVARAVTRVRSVIVVLLL